MAAQQKVHKSSREQSGGRGGPAGPDLGDGGLQLLGGFVAEHREAAQLLPGLRLSPNQLLTDLSGLLLHVVALGDQILLYRLLFHFV